MKFLRKARKRTSQELHHGIEIARTYQQFFFEWNDGVLPLFTSWIIWMAVGTLFYGLVDFNGSFCKGFYFSINVGYSIGWGVLHEWTPWSKLFSVGYLLVGAIFVSRWLAHLIEHALQESDDAYDQLLIQQRLRSSLKAKGLWAEVYIFFVMNNSRLFTIYLWVVYIFFGVAWSIGAVGWSTIDALYFSLSSMSTGGLQGVPADSPDWVFLIVGLFAATGVPLMAMAVANIAYFILLARRTSRMKDVQSLEISEDDYDLLEVVTGSNEEEGHRHALNRAEFIVLCLADRGLLAWKDLQSILKEYDNLDHAQRGVITFSVKPRVQLSDVLNPILSPMKIKEETVKTSRDLHTIAVACLPSSNKKAQDRREDGVVCDAV